jgi:hypothetical protein
VGVGNCEHLAGECAALAERHRTPPFRSRECGEEPTGRRVFRDLLDDTLTRIAVRHTPEFPSLDPARCFMLVSRLGGTGTGTSEFDSARKVERVRPHVKEVGLNPMGELRDYPNWAGIGDRERPHGFRRKALPEGSCQT